MVSVKGKKKTDRRRRSPLPTNWKDCLTELSQSARGAQFRGGEVRLARSSRRQERGTRKELYREDSGKKVPKKILRGVSPKTDTGASTLGRRFFEDRQTWGG